MTAAITFSRQNNAGLENLLLVLVLVLESKGPYYDSEPKKNNTNDRLGERKECLSTNVLHKLQGLYSRSPQTCLCLIAEFAPQ